jgi:hypothetical protein
LDLNRVHETPATLVPGFALHDFSKRGNMINRFISKKLHPGIISASRNAKNRRILLKTPPFHLSFDAGMGSRSFAFHFIRM